MRGNSKVRRNNKKFILMEISKFAKVLEIVQGSWASNDQSANKRFQNRFACWRKTSQFITVKCEICLSLLRLKIVGSTMFAVMLNPATSVIKSGASAYERPWWVLTSFQIELESRAENAKWLTRRHPPALLHCRSLCPIDAYLFSSLFFSPRRSEAPTPIDPQTKIIWPINSK